MYKHILLPTDGSDLSMRAVSAGIELAKTLNAKVTGLFVSEATYIHTIDGNPKPRAEAALSTVEKLAKEAGVLSDCVSMAGDTPQDAIIQIVKEEGCDLIIMGTHGRSRIGKFILGSVAASLLADCEIPVLLYR
jgi:nucleotide-binding universal stress UspA family protein